jgi:hypothetical protein
MFTIIAITKHDVGTLNTHPFRKNAELKEKLQQMETDQFSRDQEVLNLLSKQLELNKR